jgi:hypothetical protein
MTGAGHSIVHNVLTIAKDLFTIKKQQKNQISGLVCKFEARCIY